MRHGKSSGEEGEGGERSSLCSHTSWSSQLVYVRALSSLYTEKQSELPCVRSAAEYQEIHTDGDFPQDQVPQHDL